MVNGESDVTLDSVIVHETETGYAKADRNDAYNEAMGRIDLKKIIFSDQVKAEWKNPKMFEELLEGKRFVNPSIV